MSRIYICCLAILVPSLIATVYGIAVVLRRFRGLYFTMGVLAIVCLMIGQLSYFITAVSGHSPYVDFHIGTLGSVASSLFFLTANIGPINHLADDKSRELRKYRLLASIAPLASAALLGICILVMHRRNCFTGLHTNLLLTLETMMPLYYCTKMAIIPDEEGGFLYCMRPYNYAVTILGLLNTLERGMRNLWLTDTLLESILSHSLYSAIGLCTLVVMVLLKGGAKRWTDIS